MVYNKEILFIHIGKTGGTSAANYLCKALTAPIFNVIPNADKAKKIGNEETIKGRRHATLSEAKKFLKKIDINLFDFKKIVAVLRNPYGYEVSLFNYYKWLLKERPNHFDTAPKRKIAIETNSFKSFVEMGFHHRHNLKIKDYLTIEGKVPKNVQTIKFENLQEEFLKIGKDFGNGNMEFPHLNKMTSVNYSDYITSKEIENILFEKHKWVFKVGEYERIQF